MKLSTTIFSLLIINTLISQVNPRIKRLEQVKNSWNENPSTYVDPFVGTDAHGHTFPGATAPFGMMQLSPDTRFDGWDGCSGYHYSDSIIYGFSHTHLSGTGVSDYGDLLIVPQLGKPKIDPGYLVQNGYGDKFSHQDEDASPGYYAVKLLNQEIIVRLTSTERAGMHQYEFQNKAGKKFLLLDLDHRDKLLSYNINVENKNTVSGHRVSSAWATNQHFYFFLETNVDFEKAKVFKSKGRHKLLLTFPAETEKLNVRIGMSAVDVNGARNNLQSEIKTWDFFEVKNETKNKWDKELSKIVINGNNQDQMITFYTALYHTMIQPNVFSDVDGRYRGMDNQIHQITNNKKQYTVFSLWDTYRAAHPLYTLIDEPRTNEYIETFLRQSEQGGDLPVWELSANETNCMIGYHSVSVIADAYMKGIRNYDVQKAFSAMLNTARADKFGRSFYRKGGFISSNEEAESVSKTLEYAYDDFCIYQMAKSLNNNQVANEFQIRALSFINLFDPRVNFMRPRRSGFWQSPFEPTEVNFNYTEANSWQYSMYAPHAIDIMENIMGKEDALENWLDNLFNTDAKISGREQSDITGLIGQYAHGNEPSHHMAYLYNYTKNQYKTQKFVQLIQEKLYQNRPEGLSGNEDCGQMSAWYVLSSLGLYQIAPGHPYYELTKPSVKEARIKLSNGKDLHIRVQGHGDENTYIKSVKFNKVELNTLQISHEDLSKGGILSFELGKDKEAKSFLPSKSAMDMNSLNIKGFVPTPYFSNEQNIFQDSILVDLHSHQLLKNIPHKNFYRFQNDTANVYEYKSPFYIHQTSNIEARTFIQLNENEFETSPWVKGDFIKKDANIKIELLTDFSSQYAASGPNSLIDNNQGNNEFRTGEYLGFDGKDVEIIIHFEEAKTIQKIGISCLQDMKSWIFYPSAIEVQTSTNGSDFSKSNILTIKNNNHDYVPAENKDFFIEHKGNEPIKSIKIKVKNFGECPNWHLGKGNPTWLFIDEVLFQ